MVAVNHRFWANFPDFRGVAAGACGSIYRYLISVDRWSVFDKKGVYGSGMNDVDWILPTCCKFRDGQNFLGRKAGPGTMQGGGLSQGGLRQIGPWSARVEKYFLGNLNSRRQLDPVTGFQNLGNRFFNFTWSTFSDKFHFLVDFQ